MAGGTKTKPAARNTSRKAGEREQRIYAFVAASMREMLLDMLEKHPEIFDRPTRYPEGRAEFLKQKELNHG